MEKVLIVDDQKMLRHSLSELLTENGFSVVEASSGKLALEIFKKELPSAVLLDLKMPDMDGSEVMEELKKTDPDVPVIIITAFGDIPTAVKMIQSGAYDFIVKPPNSDRFIFTLKRAIEKYGLLIKVKDLDRNIETSLEHQFGQSPSMKSILEQVRRIADTDFSIIIQGETGTGKTFISRAVHNLSKRAKNPFIVVDIGAIPETLIESELFGYERGAFTGADKKKRGIFETANSGTLLIDELQNASPYIQGKILRAVEEKRIFPLGSASPVKIDVRIIAVTNTDITQAVKEKRFREDLFFRLGEFIINIPPLRERAGDIVFFTRRFYEEACKEMNMPPIGITEEVVSIFKQYLWPGNLRELRNVIRRAVLLSDRGSAIGKEHVGFLFGENGGGREGFTLLPLKELSSMAVKGIEKKAIKKALEITKGNKTKAAAILQVDYKTLFTKIKEYDIQ